MASIDSYSTPSGQVRYRVRIRRAGASLTQIFTTKAEAKRWAQAQEGLLLDSAAKGGLTLAEAFDRYARDILPLKRPSTQRSQRFHMRHVLQLLGPKTPLAAITPARLRGLCDQMQREGYAPASVVRNLAVLSHVFTIAIREWEVVKENPVAKVRKPKEPRGRVRFLSDEERSRLLQACQASRQSQLYSIVILALATGARQGELLGLHWSDVDLQRGLLTFQETKNGERRSVPLTGQALEMMRRMGPSRGSERVFPAPSGKGPLAFRTAWLEAVKRAGITDFRFHDLRHSAASYLAMSGASLMEIAEVLGHKTLAMVKRYAHLSEQHTRGVVERMNQAIFGS